jgi:hypothetical protein
VARAEWERKTTRWTSFFSTFTFTSREPKTMARSTRASVASNPPDLVEILAQAVLRAEEGSFPTATEEEAQAIPHLFQVLTPMMVTDPRHKGKGEPKKVLREPLLMVSWDRLTSAWKVGIADKVLNLTGSVGVYSLLTALTDADKHLVAGTFLWKSKKVS